MLLLKGGLLIDPTVSEAVFSGDVLVADGKVVEIGQGLEASGARSVELNGAWVMAGWIDLRSHLREPGQEYKETIETGLCAAAAGGFAGVCAMPGTRPVNDSRAITQLMLSQASVLRRQNRGARLYPFGTITKGMKGKELSEMAELKEAGIVGVTDDRRAVTDPRLLRRAMEYAKTFGLLLMQHCEDPELGNGAVMHEGPTSTRLGLRGAPGEAESVAVARDIEVAALTGAALHIAHVSSAGAVDAIRRAKERGLRITADVTPHHLTFTEANLAGYNTAFKVLPPLRSAADRQALREGLRDGTIDAIATDHAPHTAMEKDCEFDAAAFGMSALETACPMALALVRSGELSKVRLAEALATAPRRILGLPTGLDGATDLTIIDPEAPWVLHPDAMRSKSQNTPLLNEELVGAPRMTIVDGQVAFDGKNEA